MNYKNLWLLPKYKEQVLSKNAKRILILSQESKEMNWSLKDCTSEKEDRRWRT